MPIRRFNYTERQRIILSDARITLHEAGNGGFPSFDARLNLKSYELPPEALVFVEAYRQTARMRFAFGTAGSIQPSPERTLREFDTPDGVLFRVCVTSTATPQGKLLAEADQIRPRQPEDEDDNRLPLLSVKPDDLGHEVYRVDFSDRPLLLVNSKLGDIRAVSRDKAFVALAFPAALREILLRIFLIEEYFETEDESDWRARWLRFASLLPGMSTPLPAKGETEEIDNWIDTAVESFSRKFHLMDRFSEYWIQEGAA